MSSLLCPLFSYLCMRLSDIKAVKQLGKLLRSSRESQKITLSDASKLSGLSITHLVHIEDGNLFGFEGDIQKITGYADVYAKSIDTSICNLSENSQGQLSSIPTELLSEMDVIPFFLKKNAEKV